MNETVWRTLSDFDGKAFPKHIEIEGVPYYKVDGRGDSAQYDVDSEKLLATIESQAQEIERYKLTMKEVVALLDATPLSASNGEFHVHRAKYELEKALQVAVSTAQRNEESE